MNLLQETLEKIEKPDAAAYETVKSLAQSVYPAGMLGRLPEMAATYAAAIGNAKPQELKACTVIACADHGVARRSVSAYPIETTAQMTINYVASKGASANAFANFCGADMVVVDAGVAVDLPSFPGLWERKIAYGTEDFTQGPAMTQEQAVKALEIGISIVQEKVQEGYRCFTLGEMVVTVGVVGFLAMVLLPVLKDVMPNQEQVMFKKANYTTERSVAELVNDDEAILLATEIAKEIEEKVQYPGEIKVNVIRELRAQSYAR